MNRPQQKYSYISHPQNFPLQLKGSSKKKIKTINRQQYKQARTSINEESKSILLKKLSNNKKQCQLVKSVLPAQQKVSSLLTQNRQLRPSSVKTYTENKENINGSGVNYLMQKTSQNNQKYHKQRAHLHSSYVQPDRGNGKKHFVLENLTKQENQDKRPVHRRQTQKIKLSQDIYSNINRIEKKLAGAKKYEVSNLFKKGEELGYEDKKNRKFSDMKMIEMVGCQHVQKKNKPLRQKRQDWRVSNINFF